MSAPLYNRFRRYADREVKRFPKKAFMRLIIPSWKRPDTRVYSLSDRASYEAGYWSAMKPSELLRGLSMAYLPTPQVWIEFDWLTYNKGTNHVPWDDTTQEIMLAKGNSYEVHNAETAPVRIGAMFYQPNTPQGKGEWQAPAGCIMGFLYYVYPTGTCLLGAPAFGFHTSETMEPPTEFIDNQEQLKRATQGESHKYTYPHLLDRGSDVLLEEVALGTSYCRSYQELEPRLLKRLQDRMMLTTLAHRPVPLWSQIDGTTRIALSLLVAALSAKPPHYVPVLDKDGNPLPERPRGSERDRPIEVDVFIRDRPHKPGRSIRASVGHLEAVKKGLHTVAAHYAYRSRADGGDPTQCRRAPAHDFEKIEGSKSEVCTFCGQKR